MERDLPPLDPGRRIGPYEVVRRLGAGGSGEVWEAVLHGPAGFRKRVALKMLRTGPADPGALVREARIGALLQHPNVVGTLQLGEHEGTWCIALELVRGPSVDGLRREAGPRLPPAVVLEIGIQVAAGLQHVHTFRGPGSATGLVHRDVKPGNLLVDRSGLVKIADLGISLLTGESPEVAGTPGYMAPEQAAGAPEPRSDLFALGATLYLLATGQAPFGRGGAALGAVANVEARLGDARFLAPVDASVPGLADVVRACLRADPALRPASARELGDALGSLAARGPAGPTLLEVLARTWPTLRVAPTPAPVPDRLVSPVRGNVQAARDGFVGRRDELADLGARPAHERWVVLVGPGGVGKTRLALELARGAQRALSGGAWAFDLADARNEDGIVGAVAAGLGVEVERRDAVGHLGRVLRSKGPALVVLDNLEGCVESLPATVGRWLEIAVEAAFLGTSRVIPGLVRERAVTVGPLPPPDAVALFVARAPRALREVEGPEVEGLCGALDGMPLALELAAARLRVLDVRGIRARLSLALLSGGGPERPTRHRSVHASLRWSWELLGAEARLALGQLAVFEGSFDPAAAEAVLDLGAAPGTTWALDVLEELVEASLVQVDPAEGLFRMGQVVREFAAPLLAPEARAAAEDRHAAFHAQFSSPESVRAANAPLGYRALARRLDDLVAACRRSMARGDAEVALATFVAADLVLERQGTPSMRVRLASGLLAVPGLRGPVRGRAAHRAGWVLYQAGRTADAIALLEEAVACAREAGDAHGEAITLATLGTASSAAGRPREARAHLDQALAIDRALGKRGSIGVVLSTLGNLLGAEGRTEEARAHFVEALALHREVGHGRAEAAVLGNLGTLDRRIGRPDAARRWYEEALRVSRELGDRRTEGHVLASLVNVHHQAGDLDAAFAASEVALEILRELGNPRVEAVVLGNLGTIHFEQGRLEEARRHFEQALAIEREVGDPRLAADVFRALGLVAFEAGRIGEARERYERALVLLRELGHRHTEGALLGMLGDLEVACGRRDAARDLYDASLERLRAAGDRRQEGLVLRSLAALRAAEEEPAAARALLDQAEALLRDARAPADLAQVLALRAELLDAEGDRAGARAALDEAASLAPWSARAAREVARVAAQLGGGVPRRVG